MRKKWMISIAVVIAIAATGFFLFKANTDHIMAWQVERTVKATLVAQKVDDDRLELIFCGTGSPSYQADRGQACLGVLAAGKLFVFDTGQGAAQGLQSVNAPMLKLEAVFLTHLHSDHISGLGDVLHNSWLYGRKSEVTTFGPPGTEQTLAGMRLAFAEDLSERNEIIGSEYQNSADAMGMARDVEVAGNQLLDVYKKDGVTISAFTVDHPKWDHAYGYKITYRGKSVIISGDTRYSENLVRHSAGVDVLIHEALNENMMKTIASVLREQGSETVDPDRMELIINTHTPTHDLAKIAAEAKVKKLVVTHLIPPIPANGVTENMFIDGMADIYSGEIVVARDGMRIVVAQ